MKNKNNEIVLSHANLIFPNKWTKVRSHDLITKSQSKLLNKSERTKLENWTTDIRSFEHKGNFRMNQDMLVTRVGKKLKIEPMFDDE